MVAGGWPLAVAMQLHYHALSLHYLAGLSMAASQKLESTLTDRYQTTVPDPVRRALKLGKRDKIRYVVRSDGAVLMTRAEPPENDDPALGKFLAFLERDIAAHPERVQALGSKLATRIRTLVRGVDVDLDAPLEPEDK
jgi:antitoxin PrlF